MLLAYNVEFAMSLGKSEFSVLFKSAETVHSPAPLLPMCKSGVDLLVGVALYSQVDPTFSFYNSPYVSLP